MLTRAHLVAIHALGFVAGSVIGVVPLCRLTLGKLIEAALVALAAKLKALVRQLRLKLPVLIILHWHHAFHEAPRYRVAVIGVVGRRSRRTTKIKTGI